MIRRILPVFLLLFVLSDGNATVYYVKNGGSDAAAGTSWALGFATLQKALTTAVANDEIWIKAGRYIPTANGTGKLVTFKLKNNVKVYGGFAGTELLLTDRVASLIHTTNETILSGDINGNDTPADMVFPITTGNKADNATRVFTHVTADALNTTALLDGVTVSGGAGGAQGAGIYNQLCSPTFNNIILKDNIASTLGGGFTVTGSASVVCSPVITNSVISGNVSQSSGGGLYALTNGAPLLTNVTFSNNKTTASNTNQGGGAVTVINASLAAAVTTFTNVTFSGNTSSNKGGGVYLFYASPTLTNCTFSNNGAVVGGGIYVQPLGTTTSPSNPTFTNTSFSNNAASSDGGGLYMDGYGTSTFTGVTLANNTAGGVGSAVYFASHTGVVSGLTADGDVEIAGTSVVNFLGTNVVKNIAIGTSLTVGVGLNALLEIKGDVFNNGILNAPTGSLLLTGTTAKTLTGTILAKNMTLDNTAGASIADGLVTVTGIYTPTAGTLTTGGRFTLASTASGTASVAAGSGIYISGNVTVERYIPGGHRSWRLLTLPVTGSQTIRQAWANGAAPIATGAAAAGQVAGRGTLITGYNYTSAAAANPAGFDYLEIPNAASSIRKYVVNGAGGSFSAYAAANTPLVTTTATNADAGYMLFVRGDRKATTGTATATTLYPVGPLKTGQQQKSIAPVATHKFELVGNPYVSPIDFEDVVANAGNSTAIQANRFWIFDPNLGDNGGYYLVTNLGGGVWATTPTNNAYSHANHIQSGQAFLVEPTATGGTLTIQEEDKLAPATGVPVVFSPAVISSFSTNLFIDNGTSGLQLADGVTSVFADTYSSSLQDGFDISKIENFTENIAIASNAGKLSMEARPYITANDTLFLSIKNMQKRNYNLQFSGSQMQAGITAILQDAYLHKETAIGLEGNTDYNFTVTDEAASFDEKRFRIVFKTEGSLPLGITTAKAYKTSTGIQVEWQATNETAVKAYQVEKSTNGTSFTQAATVAAKNTTLSNYAWLDASPARGNNYYRIKAISADGQYVYSQVLKVNTTSVAQGVFTIYPNPVKGLVAMVEMDGLAAGKYVVTVYNALGQKMQHLAIDYKTGHAVQAIHLGSAVSAGLYKVTLTGSHGQLMQQWLIVD